MRRTLFLATLLSLLTCLGCVSQHAHAPQVSPGVATAVTAKQPADAENRLIPDDPAISRGVLPNGMHYYVRRNTKPEGRVELRLVVNAGSILEDDDQQGLAHFCEHMAFNGSEHFAKNELIEYLESIGMRFGADLNAYTSMDETVYMLQVPTDDPTMLDKGLLILSDWAHAVSYEDEEIDKERGVILEEWRLGRGARGRIRDKQLPVLYHGSHYAERATIGKPEIIKHAEHDVLRRFYHDWYRPELMAVVVVGDIDPADIVARIKSGFSGIEGLENPRTREEYEIPDHAETLVSVVTDPEESRSLLFLTYKLPRAGNKTYADYRESLKEDLFNAMLGARLSELAQEPDAPFLYGFAGKGDMGRTRSAFRMGAMLGAGQAEEGLTALLTEAARVATFGFTSTELARAKAERLRGLEQSYNERDKVPSRRLASEYIRNFLTGELIPGIAVELELAREDLPTIALAEINDLAAKWMNTKSRVILYSGPAKEGETPPEQAALLRLVDNFEPGELTAYEDKVLDQPLVASLPAKGSVTKTETLDELGVTVWHLSNGARVYLKPTDFKNDEILFSSFSPGGLSLAPDEDFIPASTASMIVNSSGLGAFGPIELEKALAGKMLGIRASISNQEEGMSGRSAPQDLETFMKLVYLHHTAPRKDEKVYRALVEKQEEFLRNRLSRPGTVFSDRISEAVWGDDLRHKPWTVETLEQMELETSLAFYKERFADAADFTFLFVGNLDLEVMKTLVETWLASLPSRGEKESFHDNGVRANPEQITLSVKKGLEQKSRVELTFRGAFDASPEEQYLLRSLCSTLQMRLREILREDKGGVYGVGVRPLTVYRPEKRFNVHIMFGCAPDNVQELIDAVYAEIARYKSEGIEDSYVEKVAETQRREYEVRIKQNGFWIRTLEELLGEDLPPQLILGMGELADTLDAAKLKDAATRFFPMGNHIEARLLPE